MSSGCNDKMSKSELVKYSTNEIKELQEKIKLYSDFYSDYDLRSILHGLDIIRLNIGEESAYDWFEKQSIKTWHNILYNEGMDFFEITKPNKGSIIVVRDEFKSWHMNCLLRLFKGLKLEITHSVCKIQFKISWDDLKRSFASDYNKQFKKYLEILE